MLAIDFEEYEKKPNGNVINRYSDEGINIIFIEIIALNKK